MNPSHLKYRTVGENEFDLMSLLRSAVLPTAGVNLSFEMETSRQLAKIHGRNPNGTLVTPAALAGNMKRDLTVGTGGGSTGGKLVATDLRSADFIDMLRPRSAVIGSGAMVLSGLVGNVAIPRQTSAANAYWVTEGNAPTESQPSFDQIPMSPKTISGYVDISRKLILQSSPQVMDVVKSDLLAGIGLAVDSAALNGSGTSDQPRGLLNTPGVASTDKAGAAVTWPDIVNLETTVASASVEGPSMAYAIHPSMAGKLRSTFKAANSDKTLLEGAGDKAMMNGHRVIISTQIPSTTILYGNFADLIIGLWSAIDLVIDIYTFSTSGTVRVVATQDADVAVRHVQSFAMLINCG